MLWACQLSFFFALVPASPVLAVMQSSQLFCWKVMSAVLGFSVHSAAQNNYLKKRQRKNTYERLCWRYLKLDKLDLNTILFNWKCPLCQLKCSVNMLIFWSSYVYELLSIKRLAIYQFESSTVFLTFIELPVRLKVFHHKPKKYWSKLNHPKGLAISKLIPSDRHKVTGFPFLRIVFFRSFCHQ